MAKSIHHFLECCKCFFILETEKLWGNKVAQTKGWMDNTLFPSLIL